MAGGLLPPNIIKNSKDDMKMKPFIGIDITENKKNEDFNGKEFIIKTVSQAQQQTFENAQEDALDLIEEAKLPLPLRIIQGACGIVSLLLLSGMISAISDTDGVTLAQAYQNAPWSFWLVGVCAVVWAILKFFSRRKEKEVIETTNGDNIKRTLDSVTRGIYAELDVPNDAETVDILAFTYKLKNGQPIAKESGLNPTAYLNIEVKAFVEDSNLILADLENKYAFPLSELKSIKTMKKNIAIPEWNKNIAPNKGEYKKYKLTSDRYDCVHMKSYYILELEHKNESWGIYIPCYEISKVEKLTGLTKE